jgi:hypothetical protein
MPPSLTSLEEKIHKFSFRGEVIVKVFWDCEEVILVEVILRSFSNKFGLTRNKQKSCFIMAIHGHTQIRKLGKESQNLVGRCYSIHVAALI